ncbi:MAG TPA: serine/threonine-protein kinase [Polyangia bacterium]|nr:serine/threonine-protein kinase [Polyangia bacterium]
MADPTHWVAGKYELVAPIGEGGMASVWLGLTHGAAGFTRKVAIKRILPKLAVDSSFAALFVEEARVVSELMHPNIIQIHDFDRDADGRHFIVMEWVEGIDLESYVRSFGAEPTPWALVTAIGIEVLRALAAAHERTDASGTLAPIIHRDVNPANILIGINGVVKLADFGLARAMDRVSMTAPGVVKGKLGYLSPEILMGKPANQRTDLFGVGITLWEALTKRRLFGGHPDVIVRVRDAVVPPLRDERGDLPPSLVEVVHCALAAKPEDRFESAEEMQRALASILRGQPEPTDARPLGRSIREARARLREGKA